MSRVVVDGLSLTLEAIEGAARNPDTELELDSEALRRMQASRAVIEGKIDLERWIEKLRFLFRVLDLRFVLAGIDR